MDKFEKWLLGEMAAVSLKIDENDNDDITSWMYKEVYERYVQTFLKYQIEVNGFDLAVTSDLDQNLGAAEKIA